MAWTAPKTWVPGELVDAAGMNTHVRDNLDALKVIYDAGGSEYGASARCHLSTNQSVANATWVKLLNANITQDHDDESWWNSTTSAYDLPAGTYLVFGMMMWDSNTTGTRYLIPSTTAGSGAEWGRRLQVPGYSDPYGRCTYCSTLYSASATTLAYWAYQSSGGSRTCFSSASYNYANQFGVVRLN